MDLLEDECLKASDEDRVQRQREFSHLKDICYLDYTGAGVYSQSQIDLIADQMKGSIMSHPHGSSVISQQCVSEIDQARNKILHHFGTDSEEYSVIFTSGATAAIKLVADYFLFDGGIFVYMEDNHTSVLGMREVVQTNFIRGLSHDETFSIMNNSNRSENAFQNENKGNSLFVYSAQCNFSGIKYPLSWTSKVNEHRVLQDHFQTDTSWFVLLDAASYCSSNQISLKNHKPDFISISFYKMFGYPTGLGALLVRNSSALVLNKTYYGGGTVKIALSAENYHVKKDAIHDRFEDGTMNYLSIISLRHCFDTKLKLTKRVSANATFMYTKYTFLYLKHLYYPNNKPAVKVYADTDYSDSALQGTIVNFNLLRENGSYIGYSEVQNLANLNKIQLRTGCHCNPGACQRHLLLSDETLKQHFQLGHVCGDDKDVIDGRPTGSVRISYGYASNWDDVKKFLSFIKHYFTQNAFVKFDLNSVKPMTSKNYEIEGKSIIEKNTRGKLEKKNCDQNRPDIFPLTQSKDEQQIASLSTELKLESIFIYPVKSCGFYRVERNWEINTSGLKYDRQWMIVNQSGVALTQKLETKLCLIKPDIDFKQNVLRLQYKDCISSVEIKLDLIEKNETDTSLELCTSKLCNDRVTGYDCGDEVAKWLDDRLNYTGLRLLRLKQRTTKYKLNSFSNLGQYLLITLPSIKAAIKRIENDFNSFFDQSSFVHRFRSNFVVNGPFVAYDEFEWDKVLIEIKENKLLTFHVKKPCVRCQYIFIDQETSEITDVPLGIPKFGIYVSNDLNVEQNEKLYISMGNRVYAQKKVNSTK